MFNGLVNKIHLTLVLKGFKNHKKILVRLVINTLKGHLR